MQRNFARMFNQMTPKASEKGVMLLSPGQKNVSPTVVNQMIEEEVEKRLKAKSLKKNQKPRQEDCYKMMMKNS